MFRGIFVREVLVFEKKRFYKLIVFMIHFCITLFLLLLVLYIFFVLELIFFFEPLKVVT